RRSEPGRALIRGLDEQDARRARHGRSVSRHDSRAAMPGSVFPSTNSREAPPPVDRWLIPSPTPACSTAATLSPPPTTESARRFAATALPPPNAPWANGGFPKTPLGPFPTTGRALADSPASP